jgi:AraC-like DNA-binding protein
VYTIGYLGLRQPEVFAGTGGDGDRDTGGVADEASAAGETGGPRYERSGVDPERARRHLDALIALMETERPYRDGDLTLHDLAGRLGISAHNLSEVLNTQVGRSFYDFVNGYRVEEVKEKLGDPRTAYLKLVAIASDAGFNSKSAFNAAFKRHAGMTPSEYRRRSAAGEA